MKQLGNSVAVNAVEAVASQILKVLNYDKKISGNWGNWGEFWVFLKALENGYFVRDTDLNPIKNKNILIRKVYRKLNIRCDWLFCNWFLPRWVEQGN